MTQINPDYYKHNGIEVINFINAYDLNFSLGNVVKYIARAGHKADEDTITALKKARCYLEHEIKRIENVLERAQKIRGGKSMSEFTKGTWSVGINGKYGPYVYANDGDAIIAVIRSCGDVSESDKNETVRQANARLIAAAPEMYEMLRSLSFRTSGMEQYEVLRIRELLARIDREVQEENHEE